MKASSSGLDHLPPHPFPEHRDVVRLALREQGATPLPAGRRKTIPWLNNVWASPKQQ